MSSDAIIEGLKQGNAMEMATIEEVKAGMTSVLDGMLRECFKRSDGLTELTEKLQLVRSIILSLLENVELRLMHRNIRARRRRISHRHRLFRSGVSSKALSPAASKL